MKTIAIISMIFLLSCTKKESDSSLIAITTTQDFGVILEGTYNVQQGTWQRENGVDAVYGTIIISRIAKDKVLVTSPTNQFPAYKVNDIINGGDQLSQAKQCYSTTRAFDLLLDGTLIISTNYPTSNPNQHLSVILKK